MRIQIGQYKKRATIVSVLSLVAVSTFSFFPSNFSEYDNSSDKTSNKTSIAMSNEVFQSSPAVYNDDELGTEILSQNAVSRSVVVTSLIPLAWKVKNSVPLYNSVRVNAPTTLSCPVRVLTTQAGYVTKITTTCSPKANTAGTASIFFTVKTPTSWIKTASKKVSWVAAKPVINPDTTHYSFLGKDTSGKPLRWNPCVPEVKVYLNMQKYYGEVANVKTAIAKLRETSGIPFVIKGTTTIVPKNSNNKGLNQRTNQDIIMAFVSSGTASNQTDLYPNIPNLLGIGGASWTWSSNPAYQSRITYGFVNINTQNLTRLQSSSQRISLYMHELGHATNLGHYNDTKQIMNPSLTNTTALWGIGDKTGLTRVGKPAGCIVG